MAQAGPTSGKMLPPPRIQLGLLFKQTPWLCCQQWQRFFFILQDGKLYWSTRATVSEVGPDGVLPGEQGSVDLGANPGCQITEEGISPSTKFAIRPPPNGWVQGNFTGREKGRIIFLDSNGSDPRDEWVRALRTHASYNFAEWKEREQQAKSRVKAGMANMAASAGKGGNPSAAGAAAGARQPAAKPPAQPGLSQEEAATEAAKAAHRAKVTEAKTTTERTTERRFSPLFRDATSEEILRGKLGKRASQLDREEDEAEEIFLG